MEDFERQYVGKRVKRLRFTPQALLMLLRDLGREKFLTRVVDGKIPQDADVLLLVPAVCDDSFSLYVQSSEFEPVVHFIPDFVVTFRCDPFLETETPLPTPVQPGV